MPASTLEAPPSTFTPDPSAPLPASARMLVEAIGWHATLALIARMGGTTINVPASDPGPHHALSLALGHDVARLLSASLGPDRLAVPRAMTWLLSFRDREIVARRAAGETEEQVALRFGLTSRRVRQVCAAANDHNCRED